MGYIEENNKVVRRLSNERYFIPTIEVYNETLEQLTKVCLIEMLLDKY